MRINSPRGSPRSSSQSAYTSRAATSFGLARIASMNGVSGLIHPPFAPLALIRGDRLRRVAGIGDDQLSGADPLQAAKLRCKIAQHLCPPAQEDYLETVVVVQVDVTARDNDVRVFVLQLQQPIGQLGPMMVIDQSQRGGAFAGVGLPGFVREALAQELPDRFAARGKVIGVAIPIKFR